MSDTPKSFKDKLVGLFIVQEDEDGARKSESEAQAPQATGDPVADDLIARYVGGAPQRRAPPAPKAPATPGGGDGAPVTLAPIEAAPGTAAPAQIDFPAVFKRQGLGAEEQAHVERALTLLGNLPRETPQEVKRQIVEASLIAFGVPVDRIIEGALLQQRALDLHVQEGQRETQAFVEESGRRLRELEQEAARVRKIAQDQLAHQQSVAAACGQHKQRVQEVLDFFGAEAVDRVRAASARLRE